MTGPDADATLSLPGIGGDSVIEDVDVDDDVSAADLSGEVALPPEEGALLPDPGPATAKVVLPAARTQAVPTEDAVLSGDLQAVPLIDVLGLLSRQRQTGVLTVLPAADGQRIQATFQKGRIALCTASGLPELRLGRFVLELETITQEEVDTVAAKRPPPRGDYDDDPADPAQLLGLRLCQVGYLGRDELRQVLAQQTTELFYEMLRPRPGRFVFTRPATLPKVAVERSLGAALELDVDSLLLEGFRRLRDLHLLAGELEEGALYQPAEDRRPDRLGLTREELQVLSLCTGRNDLGEIARQSRLPELDVSRILQRLQAIHIVRRRVPPTVA